MSKTGDTRPIQTGRATFISITLIGYGNQCARALMAWSASVTSTRPEGYGRHGSALIIGARNGASQSCDPVAAKRRGDAALRFGGTSVDRRQLNPEGSDFSEERAPVQAKLHGGGISVPLVPLQGLHNETFLDFL